MIFWIKLALVSLSNVATSTLIDCEMEADWCTGTTRPTGKAFRHASRTARRSVNGFPCNARRETYLTQAHKAMLENQPGLGGV